MVHLVRLLLTVPANLWAGYVTSIMWDWYVEPMGLPHLGVIRAIGLLFMVRLFAGPSLPTHEPTGREYTGGRRLLMSIVVWAFGPALTLLFGWLWRGAL